MNKVTLLALLLFSIISLQANAQAGLQHLYTLAGKSFNYSSHIPEDEVLKLCRAQEAIARQNKDYDNLFVIQQITVNTYCLKGDIGLAVDKAQQMYEEAKKLDSDLGIALSLQAIGNTHMSSDQYKQANTAYAESYEMMSKLDNKFLEIRLLMQQIHTCMFMADAEAMQHYLIEVRKLLDRADIPNKQDYIFYLQCYQTFYNIVIKDEELARLSLQEVNKMNPKEHEFNDLFYKLNSYYYSLIGDYKKALIYNDSTMLASSSNSNLNKYKNLMMDKAELLEKSGNMAEACKTYSIARDLSDSLNMIRYSKQIDSLHVNYWVDKMAIENTAMHNRFLKWFISCASILLLVAIFLIYIARKKNKQLIQSRQRLQTIRQETEASIQSKSLFLSNMSHELRTPLNAIAGFADLLSLEVVDDAEDKKMFGERIIQNADLLLRLFNDVADLSALKDKNIKFTYDTYDAVSLCKNVIGTVENVKKTNATLHFKTSLNKLPLYTDSGRLQQVLINLLVNATKFTPEGTITLSLEVDETNKEVRFTVEDTGCGIPPEKQPQIFERFEKLHEGIQGAGLGLSICQLIVEHVGGKIWIDSSYTQGARFIFTHPLTTTNTPAEL